MVIDGFGQFLLFSRSKYRLNLHFLCGSLLQNFPPRGPEVGPLEGGYLLIQSPLREEYIFLVDTLLKGSVCYANVRRSGRAAARALPAWVNISEIAY